MGDEQNLEQLNDLENQSDKVPEEVVDSPRTSGPVVISERLAQILGLESREVELVNRGEVESIIKSGDKEFVVGNENLEG